MKVISDIEEFRKRTQPLMDLDFALLDIVPTTRSGFFNKARLSELLVFCQHNPQYHIISLLKTNLTKVNTVVDTANIYMLGQGDNDPELMFTLYYSQHSAYKLKCFEFESD